jgi:decaprenylphospho-beta-D-erythro-pentofuranosid-2-ulose 2-reductase
LIIKYTSQPTSVILGASAGVGRALAEILAKKGHRLVMLARNKRDLTAMSNHLANLYKCKSIVFSLDLNKTDENNVIEIFDIIYSQFGEIQNFFAIAGSTYDEDKLPVIVKKIDNIYRENFLGISYFLNHLTRNYKIFKLKNIVVCSSISAAVPRQTNITYSSSKLALENFCKGIRHYLSHSGINVRIIRLGYVDTSLTYGKKLFPSPISAEKAAEALVKKYYHNKDIIYYPTYWYFIVLLLKLLPWFLYKRLV